MTDSLDHFDTEFKPHSKHKHLIFKTYLDAWLRKLSLGERGQDKLYVVDAFAGAGFDAVGNPGSPLLAARAADEATRQLHSQFGRTVDVRLIAIEKDADRCLQLREALAEFPNARVHEGTLEQHRLTIEAEMADSPALYFVDPFGVALNGQLILNMLAKPQHEVFLLFADQAALRHFGVVHAAESRATRRLRNRQPLLFREMEEAERKPLEEKARRGEQALTVTRKTAITVLNAAFGGEQWRPQVEAAPKNKRRETFLHLYRAMLREQAKWVLEIPMANEDGVHVYSLLHATKSAKGYVAMKNAVTFALKHSPLPTTVVDDMRASLLMDLEPVARLLLERFSGQEVRWTDDKNDRRTSSVRRTVLEDTAMYPFQLEALKLLLRQYRLPGGAIRYKFP